MGVWPARVEPFGTIGGQDAVERLMEAVRRRSRHVYGPGEPAGVVEPPTVAQVGMVLRALADHTSMEQAVTWAPDPTFHPAATSAGRWFHRYADDCEGWHRDREELREAHRVGEVKPLPHGDSGDSDDPWCQVRCSCSVIISAPFSEVGAQHEAHLDQVVLARREARGQHAARQDAAELRGLLARPTPGTSTGTSTGTAPDAGA